MRNELYGQFLALYKLLREEFKSEGYDDTEVRELIEQLTTKVELNASEVAEIGEILEQINTNYDAVVAKVNSIDAELVTIKGLLDNHTGTLESLGQRVTSQEEDYVRLSNHLSDVEDYAVTVNQSAEQAVQNATAALAKANTAYESAAAALLENEEQSAALTAQGARLNDLSEAVTREVNSLETKVDAIIIDVDNLDSAIVNLQNDFVNISANMSDIEDYTVENRNKITALQNSTTLVYQGLESRVDKTESDISSIKSDIRTIESDIEELQNVSGSTGTTIFNTYNGTSTGSGTGLSGTALATTWTAVIIHSGGSQAFFSGTGTTGNPSANKTYATSYPYAFLTSPSPGMSIGDTSEGKDYPATIMSYNTKGVSFRSTSDGDFFTIQVSGLISNPFV